MGQASFEKSLRPSFPTQNLFTHIYNTLQQETPFINIQSFSLSFSHFPSSIAELKMPLPSSMEVPEKLLQYRYHITIAIAVSVFFSLVFYAAPRMMTILAYFWPLFASTTVFLIAIIAFGGVSKFSSLESGGEKAGEGFFDYVAGGRT